MAILDLVIQAILFILPAYFANSSPVLIGKLTKGKFPIDAGKKWKGQPLLGAGKTWPGFLGGLLIGTFVGGLQGAILMGFLLSLGALTGDLVKSFFKRRLGKKRGQSWPLIDQWDFLIGAFLFVSIVQVPTLTTMIILLVITPLIHLVGNSVAYLLKLKKEWY